MHLPLTIKEIQVGYLSSSFFKDLYKYLAQNIMFHNRHVRHKVEALAESFILLDSLLFKLVMTLDKEKALLAIPENCVDKIIELYHSSLFAGHQGVIKTYLTISDKFFIPPHALLEIIFECMSHPSVVQERQATLQTVRSQNKLKLQTNVQVEYGSENDA